MRKNIYFLRLTEHERRLHYQLFKDDISGIRIKKDGRSIEAENSRQTSILLKELLAQNFQR